MASPRKPLRPFAVALLLVAACSGSTTTSSSVDGGTIDSAPADSTGDTRNPTDVGPDVPLVDSSSCGDGGSACAESSQVCDPTTHTCVNCLTNHDCALLTPFCDATTHDCVECRTASDCPYETPGCSAGSCGQCATTAGCPAHDTCEGVNAAGLGGSCSCHDNTGCGGDAPACILPDAGGASGTCGCTVDTQCPTGHLCNATLGSGVCFVSCTQPSGACNPSGPTPTCMESSGLCVACVTSADCGGTNGTPVCDPAFNCVECVVDTDCANQNPSTPYCVQELCSQCRTYLDCPSNAPGCDSVRLQCGSCSVNSDCPSGQACLNSSCQVTDAGVGDDAGG